MLVDTALGTGALWLALRHGQHRDVLAHFGVYVAVVFLVKARNAAGRVPALVRQARRSRGPVGEPGLLRVLRLLVGYDTWSRTERVSILLIAAFVVLVFGWDDGGPLAAALFLAVAAVNAGLAAVATVAALGRPR